MAIAMENNEYIRKSTEMIKKLTAAEVREKYLKELETTNKELDHKNQDLQKLYDELKSTQAQLIHSEKMASLGQLVAGISHELNNPIGFIYSNTKQLKKYIDRIEKYIGEYEQSQVDRSSRSQIEAILPDLNGLIQDTISGSQMIKEIVDNLRSFSHLDQAIWKKTDIHQCIESSLKIMLPQFKRQLKIHKSYKATGILHCNPGQINQVLLNILANAAQAIDDSGNIWISTRDENEHLLVEIKDDGKGMAPDILDKIFDPFYTTKDVGEGTGLGLSISYSIIQNHDGTISAQSQLKKGSVFTINLPYSQPEQHQN
jgi:two-component system NtrC family sensor kinase